jgi:hypothetical protein
MSSARPFPAWRADRGTKVGRLAFFEGVAQAGDAGSISIEASKLLAACGGVGFTSPSMRASLGPAAAVNGSVGSATVTVVRYLGARLLAATALGLR